MTYCSIAPCIRMEFKKSYCLNHWHSLIGQYRQRFPTVGHRREYSSWYAMLRRCYDPKDIGYKYYGGRGITVCQEWIDDFGNFYEDMGDRPPKRTLDRINVNGNYEPSNCRWATNRQQARNKRPIVMIIYN